MGLILVFCEIGCSYRGRVGLGVNHVASGSHTKHPCLQVSSGLQAFQLDILGFIPCKKRFVSSKSLICILLSGMTPEQYIRLQVWAMHMTPLIIPICKALFPLWCQNNFFCTTDIDPLPSLL